jgi:hypothetical protein
MSYQPYPTSGGGNEVFQQPGGVDQPKSVRYAVYCMWAGAVIQLIGVIFTLALSSKIKDAIRTAAIKSNATLRSEGKTQLTASQIHTLENTVVLIFAIIGIIGVLLWAWMAWANGRGRGWARIVATVLFGLYTIDLVFSFSRASISIIFLILSWLAGLGAIVFLWQRDTSEFVARSGGRGI